MNRMNPTLPIGSAKTTRRVFLMTSMPAGLLLAECVDAVTARAERTPPIWPVLMPTRVFKLRDNNKERTESWFFNVFLETDEEKVVTPIGLTLEYFAAKRLVKRERHEAEAVAAFTTTNSVAPHLADGGPPPRRVYWPQRLRVRCNAATALAIDEVLLRLDFAGASSAAGIELRVPVAPYDENLQKADLIFPLRGKFMVTQGQTNDGGHRNRSGQFAIDAIGLTDSYSPMLRDGPANTDVAGFGREVIAPGNGVVAHVRRDRPDQPEPDKSDPRYFVSEYPQNGDPGNHIIIDHGAGEFSMIAHLQAGSVSLAKGARVRQGQPIGRLGNSGDSFGPHLHYQLQSGWHWEYADALPFRFRNLNRAVLTRGSFHEAA